MACQGSSSDVQGIIEHGWSKGSERLPSQLRHFCGQRIDGEAC